MEPDTPNEPNTPPPPPAAGGLDSQAPGVGSLFEDTWRPDGSLEDIDRHLPPPGDPLRPAALRDVTVRDLELRLVHGLPARVEDYLVRWPELHEDPEAVCDLLRAEYDGRRPAEPGLGLDEFRDRFPAYAGELARRLLRLPTVPGYELLGELGRGGMGVVYRARQKSLGRLVALKLLRPDALARFRTEAEAVARLQHPNVVQIHTVGEHEGRPFLALEYCAGGSLAARLDGTPWPPEQAARLVETLARAVQHAHERGVVHRDLKPANVLFGDQPADVKVADFGLAKVLDGPGQTASGAVVGTPCYLAPEQASRSHGAVGPATDVYALGAILYELLTGRPPFQGATNWETIQQVLTREPVSPRRLSPRVDRRLETVCLKCLRKEPAGRYGSAAGLADDLGRYLRGEPVAARPAGPVERVWRWGRRRRPLAAGLAGSLVLLTVAAAADIGHRWRPNAGPARREPAAPRPSEEDRTTAEEVVAELARVGTLPLTPEFDSQRRNRLGTLLKAEAACRRLLQDPRAGPEVRVTLARVCEALSDLQFHFGDLEQARRAAEEAVAQWERLAGPQAGDRDRDLDLARAHCHLADRYRSQGDFTGALASLRRARDRMEAHAREPDATVRQELVNVRLNLAACLAYLSSHPEARALLTQTRDLLTRLLDKGPPDPALQDLLGRTYEMLAAELDHFEEADEARRCWRQARDLCRQMLAAQPDSYPLKVRLARCCVGLARAGGRSRNYAEAVRLYEEVSPQWARRAEEDPTSASAVWASVNLYNELALCHEAAGQLPLALEACRKSVRLWERLAQKRPADPTCSYQLLTSLARLLRLQEKGGLRDEAAQTVRGIAGRIDRLGRVPRGDRRRRAGAAGLLALLAPSLRLAGKPAESLRAAERSLQLYQELVAEAPDEVAFQVGLSGAWVQVGKCYWPSHEYDRVLHADLQALAVLRRVCAKAPKVREYRALLDDRYTRLERVLGQMGRRAEVLDTLREREKLWPEDAARLREIAGNLRRLAGEVGDGRTALSAEERREKERYLAESARVARKADALSRPRPGNPTP